MNNHQLPFSKVVPDWIIEGNITLKSPIFQNHNSGQLSTCLHNGDFCHSYCDLVDF